VPYWLLMYSTVHRCLGQVTDKLLMPIKELAPSVKEDMHALRSSPLIAKDVGLYGSIYQTDTGKLDEVARDPGRE